MSQLRRHWPDERARLEDDIGRGTLRLGPLSVVTPSDGEPLHLWSKRDALVLKAFTMALGPRLALSPRCVHVQGPVA